MQLLPDLSLHPNFPSVGSCMHMFVLIIGNTNYNIILLIYYLATKLHLNSPYLLAILLAKLCKPIPVNAATKALHVGI